MVKLTPELSQWKRYDITVIIAALAFSSEPRWITAKGPVEADKFLWENLPAQGASNFAAACSALNEKLSKASLMEKLGMPGIIAVTSGSHDDNWEPAVSLLWENSYFRNAWKLGFAVGDNAGTNALIKFTGIPAAVIKINGSDFHGRMTETGEYNEITARISGLIKKRYFIDDWSPHQWEEITRDYGVADWRMP